MYIVISNETPYSSTTTGTYSDFLSFASQNPNKLIGAVKEGTDSYKHTEPITDPFDPNQKLISGVTFTDAVVVEPVGSGGSGGVPPPGIPDSNLDNLTEIYGISSSLVFPCYILPKFTSYVYFTEP
jgi:hypothetical protein